jgi:hypothetical protein
VENGECFQKERLLKIQIDLKNRSLERFFK